MVNISSLREGDVLLYKATSFFGYAISLKTWSSVSHVEVYDGYEFSIASRDGQGVKRYPLRTDDLTHVLRPTVPFDRDKADLWLNLHDTEPYGFLDLGAFFKIPVDGPGQICSTCATNVLRAAGVPVFNDFPALQISPRDFLVSELLTDVTAVVTCSADVSTSAASGGSGLAPAA